MKYTIREIENLISAKAPESFVLWSDGADNWDLDCLIDAIRDNAESPEDVNMEEEYNLTPIGLTEEGQEHFSEGYLAHCPPEYELPDASPCPWSTPWNYTRETEYLDLTLSPYDMGKVWAEKTYDDLKDAIRDAEQEAKDHRCDKTLGNTYSKADAEKWLAYLDAHGWTMDEDGDCYAEDGHFMSEGEWQRAMDDCFNN